MDSLFRILTNPSSSSSTLPPFIDPIHGIAGNYSPVSEFPPTPCDVVEGSLPTCLNGVYIQNGPNPQFVPRPPYHAVDGDGMLHSVKISGGKAIYCNRFVKTRKYMVEKELGFNLFPHFFASFNHLTAYTALVAMAGVLTGLCNPFIGGIGPASTSLALIAGRIFALVETDLPYEIKITPDGDLITIGRYDFHSSGPFWNMTAHPKIDPDTGEAFAFRYFVFHPFLTFFRIDSIGRKQRDVPIITQEDGSYMHDFGLTKNFAIFPYTQVVTDVMEVLRGNPIMRVDGNKIPGIRFIPRYAQDDREMWRIDVPGLNILHVVNAWEEEEEDEGENGGNIVILASNIWPVEHALERMDLVNLSLEKIVVDTKNKTIIRRAAVSGTSLDFGSINPKYALKKTRYVYAAIISHMPKSIGLVKIDLSRSGDCTVARRLYGDGCYGSEPIFVPRNAEDGLANTAEEEDDGYLLSFVTDENTNESHLLVMDAMSTDLQIVAVVKLPQRVPQGFHAIFVRDEDT